jgi:ABC-type multidrug transport system fused ATPase/permease subunit
MFILLSIIFCTILSLYWAFGKYRISDRKWDEVGSAMATKNHDAVNVVNMEHDQAVIVNAMDDIFTSMAARERAVATGKWDNIIDEDTMEAVSRFSEAFYIRESELGHAPVQISAPVVRTAAHATHAPTAAAVPPPPPGAPVDASPKSSLKNTAKSNPKRGSAPDISRATMGGIGRRKSGVARMKQNSVARQGSKLLSNLEASMAHFEYDEVKVPLTVTFTHMHLNLKPSNTPILSDVCVSIKPFHVTAIMGPSGAGKTSLLSLLRGQAHYATIEGEITVNGHEVGSLEPFKHQTAYVPQDDIVNDDLSVEDNILYSALLFNRRGFLFADEVMPMVIRAEKLLDISHIRTSVVGNASKRGISGGQKKRVSIGKTYTSLLLSVLVSASI